MKTANSALRRLAGATIVGAVVGLVVGVLTGVFLGILAGIAVAATLFVATGWLALWPTGSSSSCCSSSTTPVRVARQERPWRSARYSCPGPGSISRTLPGTPTSTARAQSEGSTSTPHSYPEYRDFFYFSYNLGMTYQISDTNVSRTRVRSVVMRHCLLCASNSRAR